LQQAATRAEAGRISQYLAGARDLLAAAEPKKLRYQLLHVAAGSSAPPG
jgi:hypothetical protein